MTTEIQLLVALTVFPDEAYRPPLSMGKRAYKYLTYFHDGDKGGHLMRVNSHKFYLKKCGQHFKLFVIPQCKIKSPSKY